MDDWVLIKSHVFPIPIHLCLDMDFAPTWRIILKITLYFIILYSVCLDSSKYRVSLYLFNCHYIVPCKISNQTLGWVFLLTKPLIILISSEGWFDFYQLWKENSYDVGFFEMGNIDIVEVFFNIIRIDRFVKDLLTYA